ncbi:glycosyl transferase [Betaproteobacteria bacterium]|nr:glycosyl transferase [Betaproteobacteria bacterium]
MLAISLDRTAPHYPNYRGVQVYNGLGIVWFVWLLFFWVGAHLLVLADIAQPLWISYLVPIFPLIAGCCIFGLLDDWVGDKTAKGFRGHLKAFGQGVITTGGLKMIGIGLLALFTSLSLYSDGPDSVLRVIFATCVIALMANFLNLFDLRPGRAGKVYILGLILGIVAVIFSSVVVFSWSNIVGLALAGLGPILAVWRFDLGEKGMLGDCGANSMGAFLGFIYATTLPLWGLVILAAVLFFANIAGERVSFSDIINRNKLLRFFDHLGRHDVLE